QFLGARLPPPFAQNRVTVVTPGDSTEPQRCTRKLGRLSRKGCLQLVNCIALRCRVLGNTAVQCFRPVDRSWRIGAPRMSAGASDDMIKSYRHIVRQWRLV